MDVRAATEGDLPAIAAVMAAAGEPVDWPGRPGWPYLEDLLARPGVRLAVATTADGGVVGMGGSIPLGADLRFLTDLFVHPDRQSSGVGRALLGAVLDGAPGRATFSSADPRALGAYLRAGMRPWWPLLYLEVPRAAMPAAPRDRPTLLAGPADVATTAALDEAWTGLDHGPDFEDCAGQPDAAGWLVRDGATGTPVGIGWARRARSGTGRCLEHGSTAPGADPRAVTETLLSAALGDAERLLVTIPGPHPIVPVLLERGARIRDRDTFCSTDRDLVDPERILPSAGFL